MQIQVMTILIQYSELITDKKILCKIMYITTTDWLGNDDEIYNCSVKILYRDVDGVAKAILQIRFCCKSILYNVVFSSKDC